MKVNKKLVADGLGNHPNRPMKSISKITIHTTGNRNPRATAEAHARLQAHGNNGRKASWHYTVDEKEIWQSFKDNQKCWHTGTKPGNENSIGIEICVNSQTGFANACKKAAWLTSALLKKYCLNMEDVTQHNHWSGKNCPAELRSGEWNVDWQDFLNTVRLYLGKDENPALRAMREAGIKFDGNHWRGVFEGTVSPEREWTKILTNRIIDKRWDQMDAELIQSAFKVLLGKSK